jgi:hypothetical protein
MNNDEIPAPNVARADSEGFYLQCPACGEFVKVDLIESKVESGGYHSEADVAKYQSHYREQHG